MSAGAVLEVAAEQARVPGNHYVRPEHILLAAVSRKLHSPAAAVLAECGAGPDEVRDRLIELMLEQAPELSDRLRDSDVAVAPADAV